MDKARAIYDALLARHDSEYVPPFALAVCEAGLGDHEAAIASCLAAVEARDVLLGLFQSWVPGFEPLRADPRFTHLMQRFNAQEGAGRSSSE
jgi:hypothetical protein